MPLTTFFLPMVCASRTASTPPLPAPWYRHTHFPILSKLLGPWVPTPANPPSRLFKWTVILVTLLRQGTSTRWTGDTRVFQSLAQNLVKWGQVCISLTLYILFGYLPLSPTDPPNGILLKRPSATKAHTQWSKYFSFFPSLVSVTKMCEACKLAFQNRSFFKSQVISPSYLAQPVIPRRHCALW